MGVRAALAASLVAITLAGAANAAPDRPEGGAGFDYYVLALSWSPAFCAGHPAHRAECGLRRGFVAHGLWPQYAGGGGPEHCAAPGELDREAIAQARSAMPDERLIRHEWVVHGTCSGLAPRDYFQTLIRAVGRLSIPDEFDGETPHSLTARQIADAFVRANPSLPASSLALRCRGGQFEELRICLSRDLHPAACGRGVRSHCGTGALTISSSPAARSAGR